MEKKLKYFINLSFIGYFVILLAERIMSVLLSFATMGFEVMFKGAKYDLYTFTITLVSIVAFLIFFGIFCNKSIVALWNTDKEANIVYMSIAAGILLISGMMDTKHSTLWLQFVAYAFLIAAFVLKAILDMKKGSNKLYTIVGLVYVIAFSMAIPVTHMIVLNDDFMRVCIYMFNAVASVLVCATFTAMLASFFTDYKKLMINSIVFGILAAFDIALLAWRGAYGDTNTFLLVSLIVTAVMFVALLVLSIFFKEKEADRIDAKKASKKVEKKPEAKVEAPKVEEQPKKPAAKKPAKAK